MKKGYTLIEVMIALAVFAIIATIASSVMIHAFNVRARVSAKANQLDELQLVMTLLEHDLIQFIPRTVRTVDSRVFAAFTGTYQYMEFTRSGLVNPNAIAKRSTLKRVAYLCNGKKLIRRTWGSLDTLDRNQYEDKILLTSLSACSFAYMSLYHQMMQEWRSYSIERNQKREILPRAVQLTLDPYGWGKMKLLFVLPEGLYAF